MDKKSIAIIVSSGLFVLVLTFGIIYLLSNKNNLSHDTKTIKTELKVGNFTLKYGKYKGLIEEYDPDTEKMDQEIVYIEITESMIKSGDHSETYSINGNSLITSNRLIYEVIANNKIRLDVGGGVEYEYNG